MANVGGYCYDTDREAIQVGVPITDNNWHYFRNTIDLYHLMENFRWVISRIQHNKKQN